MRTSEMAVESAVLYGEMAGSWVLHLVIPLLASLILRVVPQSAPRILIFILIITVMSLVVQTALIAFLQQSACNGVKNYKSVLAAGGVAAVVTACMVAIPAYVEPMRLVVSQLFGDHKKLLSPEQAATNDAIIKASEKVSEVQTGPVPDVQVGGAMSVIEFEAQQEKEISYGASYWAAFAGAYGIAIGSIMAGKCS
jgi:hypothetical protein